jgi:hypothetical protein
METFIYIALCAIGWLLCGDIILGGIDQEYGKLEITTWKLHAVWWLKMLMNLFWPIVMITYLNKRKHTK